MENKIVVANFKMNMMLNDIGKYLNEINNNISSSNVVICPSSIYIPYFLKKSYQVGVQNIFYEDEGSYTGEISPKQVASMGVTYVIIGHSERRTIFNEINIVINKKTHEALKHNLKVILCIGETKEEKESYKTDEVLKEQLINGLKDLDKENFKNIIIAYEPVWAIGSDNTPSNSEIKNTVDYIKMIINNIYPNVNVRVLYGGSVNEDNITELNKIDNLSGFLIGGASIDAQEFIKIVKEVVVDQ